MGGNSEDAKCTQKTCGTGEDVCTYGYATIKFKGPFSISGDQKDAPEVEMDIVMDWFKDCGKKAESTCDNIKDMMTMLQGDQKNQITVSNCDIKTCNTDDCNDKTATDINPNALKEISCYTCQKTTIDGKPNTDTSDPDQPDCSASNKMVCPIGTESCIMGNIAGEEDGKKMEMEYFKACGSSGMSSCDSFEKMLALAGSESTFKMNKCNIKSCTGDLCNTGTAAEVAAYSHATSLLANGFLTSLIIYLWL